MSREDQYNVTTRIGTFDLGTFDTMSGGEPDSEEAKRRPGNMGRTKSYGGPQTVENVVISRVYELDRDDPIMSVLLPQRGRSDMVVVKQSLDVDGNPFGTPWVYTGTFKRIGPTEPDSDSNDPAMFELELSSAEVHKA